MRFGLYGLCLLLCVLTFDIGSAITSLNVDLISKSVVFFFPSDQITGEVIEQRLIATGFLVLVRSKNGAHTYPLLVTARHVVDPVWRGCRGTNPTRLYIRVNKARFDQFADKTGTANIAIDLLANGTPTWTKSDDDSIDVVVLKAPGKLLSGDYDVRFLNFRNFGAPEEIAKIGIGSQTASAGLVQSLAGEKRNNPVFHFGKIASIPAETAAVPCAKDAKPHFFRVWWLATTLVAGASGSPIFFDPLFPPGADISAGEPRAMIIGLQSLSLDGADLAGMTPTKYIVDVISRSVGSDADLSLGAAPQ